MHNNHKATQDMGAVPVCHVKYNPLNSEGVLEVLEFYFAPLPPEPIIGPLVDLRRNSSTCEYCLMTSYYVVN